MRDTLVFAALKVVALNITRGEKADYAGIFFPLFKGAIIRQGLLSHR
jgi:hypothetical protein